MNNKRPSKPSLPNVLEPSKLLLLTGFSEPCLLQLSQILQFNPIAFANDWLLPILPTSTKTSFYTQIGCSKCLGYQPLKDLDVERQEQRKSTRKCVDDCGYNLTLKFIFQGFLSENHSLQYVGNDGIYSVGKDLVKQNMTNQPNRMFCKYFARIPYLQDTHENSRLS